MGAGKMQIGNEINAKTENRPKITGRKREITEKSRKSPRLARARRRAERRKKTGAGLPRPGMTHF
jgi:hypothetical protein